ncbi:hypothetical protein [Kitasatospora acidiphila]|nr:hypothetical protein [Kitasatospora acidiphila]
MASVGGPALTAAFALAALGVGSSPTAVDDLHTPLPSRAGRAGLGAPR